jgi:hypothetical protein
MAARNYDMASNMENRNIQQALSRYDMRNNDYMQPNMFRYGANPIVRTEKADVMNNKALERRIGGTMCGCAMSGGAVNSVLGEMDNRYDAITNKNFTSPYKSHPQYIQSGNINFVPYYNMVEMAQLNSRGDAENIMRGRGIDYAKYANQAKDIGAKYVRQAKDIGATYVKEGVKELMKDDDVKKLAQEAINDPAVRNAVSKILNDAKSLAKGGSIYSALGKAGTTALSVGSKVGSAGLKYGAVAVEVGAKYGAKGVAVATAVANNPAVQKVAQAVIDNPQVQEAVVGIIAEQVAKIAPKPKITDPDEETGGAIRRRKRGGMMALNKLKERIKEKVKGKPSTTQITLAEFEDDDDFFKEDEEEEKMYKKLLKEKASATKNQKGTEMSDMSGSGVKRGKNKRALIVKKVMQEKGLGLIEASKYVKKHGLY